MSRDLTAAAAAAANAAVVRPAIFFEGEFASGTLNLWSGVGPIEWDGKTWTGAGQMLGISPIEELSDIRAAAFHVSLSGDAASILSINLGQARSGLPGKVWLGFFEPEYVDFDFTRGSILAQVGAGEAAITFTRSGATATRVNEEGLIETVAADTPRWDYNPITLAIKGLLIEEARTNVCLRSAEFDSGTWVKSGNGTGSAPVVTANAGISPDGTQNAERIVMALNGGTTTNDRSQLAQGISPSIADGVTRTFSVYFKSNDSNTYQVQIRVNGTVTLCTVVPDVWTRFSITGSSGADPTLWIALRGSQGTSDSADILAFGAQVEVGAFASSYIPTTSASVTRNADVAVVSDISGFLNADEGALFGEFIPGIVDSNAHPALSLNGGSSSNQVYVGHVSTSRMIGATGGSTEVNLTGGAVTAGTLARTAGSYRENDYAFSLNGGTVATDASAAVPTVTQANIGGPNAFNGHVRRVAYFPKRLSNSDLQALSAGGWGEVAFGSQRIIADPFLCYEGRFDVPDLVLEGARCTIQARYESRLIDLDRPRMRRYTHEDQQIDYPGDRGFEFVPLIQDKELYWGRLEPGGALSARQIAARFRLF